MLEAESCAQGISLPCGIDENGEEELSLLPRHTKVIVTGNNRTSSLLVGLHGVVKKAVGLGGWHWLVLTNGREVKLQRNALSVLEAPTGLEEDEDESEDRRSTIDNPSTPFREKGRIQKSNAFLNKVDFSKLDEAALHRYWRHFNLAEVCPNPSREQLIDAVERHFMSQQLDELKVINSFVQAAKRLKTVCG